MKKEKIHQFSVVWHWDISIISFWVFFFKIKKQKESGIQQENMASLSTRQKYHELEQVSFNACCFFFLISKYAQLNRGADKSKCSSSTEGPQDMYCRMKIIIGELHDLEWLTQKKKCEQIYQFHLSVGARGFVTKLYKSVIPPTGNHAL